MGGGSSPTWYKRFDFAYNAAGQFGQITAYHYGAQISFYSHYAYDEMGRIQQLTHTTSSTAPTSGFGSGALAGHAYTYDDASRVTSRTSLWWTEVGAPFHSTQGTVTYDYDNTNQLLGEDRDWTTDDSYDYDLNGNREQFVSASGASTVNYTIGANNQLDVRRRLDLRLRP